jgi:hypothetical protein
MDEGATGGIFDHATGGLTCEDSNRWDLRSRNREINFVEDTAFQRKRCQPFLMIPLERWNAGTQSNFLR